MSSRSFSTVHKIYIDPDEVCFSFPGMQKMHEIALSTVQTWKKKKKKDKKKLESGILGERVKGKLFSNTYGETIKIFEEKNYI